ncbi:hypothetical protein ACQPZJ_28095 [Actinoplanes sp. CA-054009]
MTIAAWPVAHRNQLVHAFKPGERTSEAPFRTLRKHSWATPGVRISPRSGNKLAGQFTMFSSLNVESARLARHGNGTTAVRIAAAARELESRSEFGLLLDILAEMPPSEARDVIDGVIPEGAPRELLTALIEIARLTEEIRERELAETRAADFVAGRVKEVHDTYVLLVLMSGPETLIPRWMAAGAANGARVGSFLALITDKLGDASAVIDVVPALDVSDDGTSAGFTPFGRGDKRALAITAEDERLLKGDPQPLRVLVPVTVEP